MTSSPGISAIPPDAKVRAKERTKGHDHPYLSGNFYPVFEETVGDDGIECQIIGTIPESLRGSQYVRTGPNSLNVPDDDAPHHFFEGEGMLHGVYFEPGVEGQPIRARYMNRWVRSEIFKKASKYGKMTAPLGLIMAGAGVVWGLIINMIWYRIKAVIYRLKNTSNGNTALAFFGSRLLALQETGRPWETSVPSLNTTGDYYFEEENLKEHEKNPKKGPKQEVCTAHPKVDPTTGEMIFFSYRSEFPFAYYSVVSAKGKRLVWEEPIPGMEKAVMMHDFAISPSHSIILNVPYFIDSKHKKEGKPVIAFDPNSPSRFGLVPRYFDPSKDQVIWFESRACHIFHTANAWDEKDADGNVVAVCMTACRSERFVSDVNLWQPSTPGGYGGGKTEEEYQKQYSTPGSGDYSNQDPDMPYLTLFRFDLKTKETQMTTLSAEKTEFPSINWDRYMQPNLRYVYGAIVEDSAPGVGLKFKGINKTDTLAVTERMQKLRRSGEIKNKGGEGQWEVGSEELQRLEKERGGEHIYGPHMYGGEALFVPNLPQKNGQVLDEDDGHLLVYVYDERQMENGLAKSNTQVTELWIFDAKKIAQNCEPVAKVKIPRRVPYGFHGLLVTSEQIQANKDMLARRRE
ncbi:carotenoid oxygenase [Mortierella sp. GBAus27b]|nr:hypothetical protein BGX31_008417 [Mortierella sp. GBA43]KAI8361470.1 carotenoid oxygenase [Mortierella sp. GBAus27b]